MTTIPSQMFLKPSGKVINHSGTFFFIAQMFCVMANFNSVIVLGLF